MTNMPNGITAKDLESFAATAAADITDSLGSPDDEASEQDEQPDELDELEDEEDTEDDDLEDEEDVEDDLEVEDEEDADDEEEDDEDLEDEEESEEEGDDEEGEQGEQPEPLEYDPDLVVLRPDGTSATLRELHEGNLRHDDYTRKSQRNAEIFNRMSKWYEEHAADPEGWVAEIAHTAEAEPAKVLAGAIQRSEDVAGLLGQTLRHLVESGAVPDKMVEALNLQVVAEEAKANSVHDEVKALREELRQQKTSAAQQAADAEIAKAINDQWLETVEKNGLLGMEPQALEALRIQTLQFAAGAGIPNVSHAYTVMTAAGDGPSVTPKPKPKGKPRAKRVDAKDAVQRAKRKTAVMSRTSTGGSGPTTKRRRSQSIDSVIGDAAEDALNELFG